MTAAEVARKAADLLERDGWCQWNLCSDNGEHCLAGALMDTDPDTWYRVTRFVGERVGTPYVTDWNDEPERTAHEVIALLRQVAAELEGS